MYDLKHNLDMPRNMVESKCRSASNTLASAQLCHSSHVFHVYLIIIFYSSILLKYLPLLFVLVTILYPNILSKFKVFFSFLIHYLVQIRVSQMDDTP